MKDFFRLSCILVINFAFISPCLAQSTQPASQPAVTADNKINMNRVKILLDKAREEILRGNDADAGKYLSELSEIARQAWNFQDVTTCETVFRQILTVKADYPDALLGLAELYRRTNPVWATEFYSKYLQMNPSDVAAYYGRGSCYLTREAYTLAIQDLKYLVDQLSPTHVGGLTNLALAYRGRAIERNRDPELFNQAVEYMKRAVQSAEMMKNDPETLQTIPELRYRLGRLIFEYDQILAAAQREVDYKDAISSLMLAIQSAYQAVAHNPENIDLLNQIIYSFDALSEVYSAQIQLNPKDPLPYMQLAKVIQKKMEVQNRQSLVLMSNFYRKAVEADPKSAEGWLALAVTYDQLGMKKTAIEAVEKAISLDPDNANLKKIRDSIQAQLKTLGASAGKAGQSATTKPSTGKN